MGHQRPETPGAHVETADVRVISNQVLTEEEDRYQRFRVLLQQTGGDPSSILMLLATIVRNKDWRRLTDRHQGGLTFLGYFQELGWSKSDLLGFVETMHHKHERPPKLRPEIREEMEELRRQVRDLANPPLLPLGPPLGSRNNPSGVQKPDKAADREVEAPFEPNVANSNIRSGKKQGSTQTTYITSRLKRDAPALAEKVICGEITPRAAAIKAGFLKPEFSIPIEPQGAARRILNRFRGEPLLELIRVLVNHAGGTFVEPESQEE
jgi:hypothetical protein